MRHHIIARKFRLFNVEMVSIFHLVELLCKLWKLLWLVYSYLSIPVVAHYSFIYFIRWPDDELWEKCSKPKTFSYFAMFTFVGESLTIFFLERHFWITKVLLILLFWWVTIVHWSSCFIFLSLPSLWCKSRVLCLTLWCYAC